MPRESRLPKVLFFVVPWIAALTTGCVTLSGGSGGVLPDEIDRIISEPPLNQVNWGIQIIDPERGQILYSRHAHLKFVPASNQKILSVASALNQLGSDHRYRTDLFGYGALEQGGEVLQGDLLLHPSGDPTLSERFYPTSEAPLDSIAEDLWSQGVRTVTGTLVVDASRWDSTSVPGSWEVDDLPATYAASGGAFSIAEGAVTVEVTAGKVAGAPATARWWPSLADDRISVGFLTIDADSSARGRRIEYRPESRRLRIRGRIPVGQVDTLRFSQRDPVRIAARALLRALEGRGIRIQGGVRIAWDPGEELGPGRCSTGEDPEDCPEAFYLAGLVSPPMGEIAGAVLEPSQNWMAEQLIRTLGEEFGECGSWREGLRIQEEFLTRDVGIDSLDLYLRDASGMSTKNLVTPRAVVRLLDFMRDSPHAGVFRNALASPGEEDSTLENRLTSLSNRVFAKTGTITHVNSLSGYVFTDSGKELIFSILTNGSGLRSSAVRAGIDRVTEVLSRY